MRSSQKFFGLVLAGLAALLSFEGCGSKARAPALATGPGNGGSSSGGNGGAGASKLDASAGGGSIANCGELTCSGHEHCVGSNDAGVVLGANGACVCDEGYIRQTPDGGPRKDASDTSSPCVVDTGCIKIRYLGGDSCRFQAEGAPAVGLFFAVDYCAGTAVLPAALGNLSSAFSITEDGVPVGNNTESFATIVPRDVESYVTFVIDVSKSLTDDKTLVSQLVTQLSTVSQSLKRPAPEPPTAVSILIFGRFVNEYLPFTTNLADVAAKLDAIAKDPLAAANVVDGTGTSLNEAVEKGIHGTERIQALREVVTESGVLTSGTVVVVSDGRDDSGLALDTALIQSTHVNVISVGISSDIDDRDLSAIGRDGSFLAPTPADWTKSFQEIAQRVQEYPLRAYLLGYCSSEIVGTHQVNVRLAADKDPNAFASCSFDAANFGGDSGLVCNANYFKTACTGHPCGGLIACGACPDTECCMGGTCQVPSSVGGECHNQDELCKNDGTVCIPVPNLQNTSACTTPAAIGDKCNTASRCAPGEAFCLLPVTGGDGTCTAIADIEGANCGDTKSHDGYQCPSLNCGQKKPDNPGDEYVCLPQARAFDLCSGTSDSGVCEPGTACQSNVCTPRHPIGCKTDLDCATGYCDNSQCRETGACYFSWASDIQH